MGYFFLRSWSSQDYNLVSIYLSNSVFIRQWTLLWPYYVRFISLSNSVWELRILPSPRPPPPSPGLGNHVHVNVKWWCSFWRDFIKNFYKNASGFWSVFHERLVWCWKCNKLLSMQWRHIGDLLCGLSQAGVMAGPNQSHE